MPVHPKSHILPILPTVYFFKHKLTLHSHFFLQPFQCLALFTFLLLSDYPDHSFISSENLNLRKPPLFRRCFVCGWLNQGIVLPDRFSKQGDEGIQKQEHGTKGNTEIKPWLISLQLNRAPHPPEGIRGVGNEPHWSYRIWQVWCKQSTYHRVQMPDSIEKLLNSTDRVSEVNKQNGSLRVLHVHGEQLSRIQ